MVDSFYTPLDTARKLVSLSQKKEPKIIADFAAGFGSLLQAAKESFPNAQFFFNDNSEKCFSYLLSYFGWSGSKINFLDSQYVKVLLDSDELSSKCDIIFLNPPFSQRGGSTYDSFFGELVFSSSVAFAFIINSLNFLKEDGELIAILPASCLTSEKDSNARSFIHSYYSMSVDSALSHKTFDKCCVHTVCVRIVKKIFNYTIEEEQNASVYNTLPSLQLFRGKLSIHNSVKSTQSNGFPFIHTTNLKEKYLNPNLHYSSNVIKPNSTISGPCLLLPRVCKPSFNKISIYSQSEPIVISDCIISISSLEENLYSIEDVYEFINNNWSLFRTVYHGTCAQYTTLKHLQSFFHTYNIYASILNSYGFIADTHTFFPS
jgi:hypothetical protein